MTSCIPRGRAKGLAPKTAIPGLIAHMHNGNSTAGSDSGRPEAESESMFWASAPEVDGSGGSQAGPAILEAIPSDANIPSKVLDMGKTASAGDGGEAEPRDATKDGNGGSNNIAVRNAMKDGQRGGELAVALEKDPPPSNVKNDDCSAAIANSTRGGGGGGGGSADANSAGNDPDVPAVEAQPVYEFRVNRAPSGLANGRSRSPDPGMLPFAAIGNVGGAGGGSGSMSAASSIASFYGDHDHVSNANKDVLYEHDMRWQPRDCVQAGPSPGLAAKQEAAQLGLFAALKLASDRDLRRSGWTQRYLQQQRNRTGCGRFCQQQQQQQQQQPRQQQQQHLGEHGGWDVSPLLRAHGLGHYSRRFQEQEIDFEAFQMLTETDLEKLGIGTIGAKRKLLRLIHQSQQVKKRDATESVPRVGLDVANLQQKQVIFDSPSRTELLLKTVTVKRGGSSGAIAGQVGEDSSGSAGLRAKFPAVKKCPQCGQPHAQQPARNAFQQGIPP